MDYATSATAILGIRDSGKTVTAKGIAEQLLDQGIPIIVFDAVGKWRFLKIPSDSDKGKGYKVVVVGGRGADLPLNPHSISEIVRASIRENIPLVIDLYDPKLSKADWRHVVQQSIRIIHYENEGVRHVFLEEAAEYVPQKVYDNTTYGEVEKFVRMGGNASVGLTLINQRSQEVNKAVLDLCQNLVLGCQIGNRAIEAVEKWVDRLSPEVGKKVTSSLPRLKAGQAWVWTKSQPDDPQLAQMPMCRSLHPDRRTPDKVVSSRNSVDAATFVQALGAMLPKVIEEQKANDPAELKRTIADLKRKLAQAEQKQPETKHTEIETPVFDAACRQLLERVETTCNEVLGEAKNRAGELQMILTWLTSTRERLERTALRQQSGGIRRPAPAQGLLHAEKPAPTGRPAAVNGSVGGGMRRMLIALAQRSPLNKKQLAVRAGLSANSGTFGSYLSDLRSQCLISGSVDSIVITEEGIASLGAYDPLPTGRALLEYWTSKLGGGTSRMLVTLADAYPNSVSKEDLGQAVGMSPVSGTFGTYLSKLRTLELIEGSRELRASDELFNEK